MPASTEVAKSPRNPAGGRRHTGPHHDAGSQQSPHRHPSGAGSEATQQQRLHSVEGTASGAGIWESWILALSHLLSSLDQEGFEDTEFQGPFRLSGQKTNNGSNKPSHVKHHREPLGFVRNLWFQQPVAKPEARPGLSFEVIPSGTPLLVPRA